jgi:hypothetical protein
MRPRHAALASRSRRVKVFGLTRARARALRADVLHPAPDGQAHTVHSNGAAAPRSFATAKLNNSNFAGLSPGQTNWLDLDVQPGNYIFVCFFPDLTKGGLPHALEGMVTVATVT